MVYGWQWCRYTKCLKEIHGKLIKVHIRLLIQNCHHVLNDPQWWLGTTVFLRVHVNACCRQQCSRDVAFPKCNILQDSMRPYQSLSRSAMSFGQHGGKWLGPGKSAQAFCQELCAGIQCVLWAHQSSDDKDLEVQWNWPWQPDRWAMWITCWQNFQIPTPTPNHSQQTLVCCI